MSEDVLHSKQVHEVRRVKRGRRLRRIVNRIHLWSALIGALPALALCLSGLILVFESELRHFEERAHARVEPVGGSLPIGGWVDAVERQAGSPLTYLAFPRTRNLAALAATEDGRYHFVDPYRGKVGYSTDRPATFMLAVRVFHTSFFAGEFGTWVAIISSLFLVFLCITGGYLFLKRKLSTVKKFRIHWKNAKRRNYDLHAVAGFITAIPIALISLSGVLIGLGEPWRETILFLTDSEFAVQPKLEIPLERAAWNFDYDRVLQTALETAPKGMYVDSMTLPTQPEDPIRLRLLYPYATRPASLAYVNPADGGLLDFQHHWEYEPGHLIHRLNRGFHSGELYTDAMRWLWFVLMLVPFLLAYTGYRQWRKK